MVAAGNSGAPETFVPLLLRVLEEEGDAMVLEHVRWAIARLEGREQEEEEERQDKEANESAP